LAATPAPDVEVWALEESIPLGWTVSAITDGGLFDAISRKVKWGPYIDAIARTPSYTLTPPSGARAPVSLAATVRFGDAVLSRNSDIVAVPSRLVRSAPSDYLPGVGFTVALTATPAPYVQVFAVEEEIPAGWTPSGITLGGTYDSVTRSLRWGPFIDPAGIPVVLSYHLVPSAGSQASLMLAARGRFDDVDVLASTTIPRHLDNPASLVRRTLPAYYIPDTATPVSLTAIPIDTALVYAVEERVPNGWTTTSIGSGGSWDAVNRTIKWGPFFDGTATVRTLTYEVVPPADAFGPVSFAGTARFDLVVVATGGDTALGNSPPTVTRGAPPRFTAGVPFDVTLALEPVPGVELQAVEEQIPAGWTASTLTDGGTVDPNSRMLKWGPFIDRSRRTLTYRLLPPATAAGTNTLGGTGHFNRDSLEIGGARALAPNAVPVAVPIAGQYRPGQTLKIALLRILAAASDADGDLLRIASAAATSDAGGDVHIVGSFLFYSPPPGYSGIDHMHVRITDPYGGGADAAVDLVPVTASGEPTRALISITALPGGRLSARFAGVPGRHYRVQASDTLTPPIPWSEIACGTAGSDGQFVVTATPPGVGGGRYYRLVSSATPCN